MIWFLLGVLIGFILGSYTYYCSRRRQIHKEKMEIFNDIK